MTEMQIYLTLGIFVAVILTIAFDLLDMTITALLGVGLMLGLGLLQSSDISAAGSVAGGPLALLFGGMVVARVLATTGLFDRIEGFYLRRTRGSGKRYLLLLVALVAPICALLPNATTVILLAPVIIGVARALQVDFVGPMILTAIVSNAAGMLTLVGDPATFLVGSSIGMTFIEYLQKVSIAGLLSVLVVIPLLPWLLPEVWNARVELPMAGKVKPIQRPWFMVFTLFVLVLMVTLFLVGELLPQRILPPSVAIIAASLALLVIYCICH
jgi:Na+/H+ antiporter NhaD/arsenite permease-like protein